MAKTTTPASDAGPARRDFLELATGSVALFGVGAVAWPFIDQMNPAADTLALGSIKVDLSGIEVGQSITVKWRGAPVFIRRRTPEEIKISGAVKMADLKDPELDSKRAPQPQWLIMVGVCTHLGCIPKGQKANDKKGEFGGWFCPCHASHYDLSGRIRKGPAPRNLPIPPYTFLPNNIIKIG